MNDWLIILGMGLGVLHHSVDLVLVQAARGFDDDGLFLPGCLVFCRNIQDTVGVNIKRYFDLWHTAWRWWDIAEVKTTQRFITCCHLALTL